MYSVSKAAATHLGRNLANELGPRNITTNIVEPGFFPSKLANGLIEVMGGVEQLEKFNPLGRLGEPEDIASVMIYICSKAGSYLVCILDPGATSEANMRYRMVLAFRWMEERASLLEEGRMPSFRRVNRASLTTTGESSYSTS